MSEKREPIETWKRTTNGKTTKIELFPAHYFAEKWEPGSRLFTPRPPCKTETRIKYWESMFRVRVDGVWFCKCKYTMMNREQIAHKFNFV